MKNVLTAKEPSMDEYAAKRKKDKMPKIRDISVRKADGGYIVDINEEYNESSPPSRGRKPKVYRDLAGVHKCLMDAFGK